MSLIKTIFYPKPKEGAGAQSKGGASSSASVTNVTNVSSASVADRLAAARKIWGNDFDGTQDVEGDLTIRNHNLAVYGDAEFRSYFRGNSYVKFDEAESDSENSRLSLSHADFSLSDGAAVLTDSDSESSLTLDPKAGIFGSLSGNSFSLDKSGLLFDYAATIQAAQPGSLAVRAENIYSDKIGACRSGSVQFTDPVLFSEGVALDGDLTVKTLRSQNIRNSGEVSTKDLTVTGKAHFFDLVIDSVEHAGGQTVLSAASFRIDDADEAEHESKEHLDWAAKLLGRGASSEAYECLYLWQVCVDGSTGDEVYNEWAPGDHLFSCAANAKTTDGKAEFDQRSSWTLVLGAEHGISHKIDGVEKPCNRLEIVTKVKVGGELADPSWGAVALRRGDSCALLGSETEDRRNAIVICAYKSVDPSLEAPMIAQYSGIDGYDLQGKETTYLAKNGNRIVGSLVVQSTGKGLEDSVRDYFDAWMKGEKTYVHSAYCDDPTKTDPKEAGLVKVAAGGTTVPSEKGWVGFATTRDESDASLGVADYAWQRTDADRDSYRLVPVRETLYLDDSGNLILDAAYSAAGWRDDKARRDAANRISFELQAGNGSKSLSGKLANGIVALTQTAQTGWDGLDAEQRYVRCRVSLKDAQGKEADARTIRAQMEPGAVMSVTDKITQRVSDGESRVSTLEQSVDGIKTSVQNFETGDFSELKQTVEGLRTTVKSVQDEADGNKTDISTLTQTAEGIKADVESVKTTADGNKTDIATLEQTVEGLSSTVSSVQTDLQGKATNERVSKLEQTVEGFSAEVSDRQVGGENLLDGTDFGRDGNAKDAWSVWDSGLAIGKPGADSPTPERGFAQLATSGTTAWTKSGSESYVEALRQSLKGKLKPDTWYTLSFYARGLASDEAVLRTYVYPNVGQSSAKFYVDGDARDSTPSDCCAEWKGAGKRAATQAGWRKRVCTFKTDGSIDMSDGDYSLLFRVFDGSAAHPTVGIAMAKLEEGQTATDYGTSAHDREALMRLTADEFSVTLRDGLKETGIDVQSGQITLDADKTTINGDLALRKSDDGLVVYDSDGFARVRVDNARNVSSSNLTSCEITSVGKVWAANSKTASVQVFSEDISTSFGAGCAWAVEAGQFSAGTANAHSATKLYNLKVYADVTLRGKTSGKTASKTYEIPTTAFDDSKGAYLNLFERNSKIPIPAFETTEAYMTATITLRATSSTTMGTCEAHVQLSEPAPMLTRIADDVVLAAHGAMDGFYSGPRETVIGAGYGTGSLRFEANRAYRPVGYEVRTLSSTSDTSKTRYSTFWGALCPTVVLASVKGGGAWAASKSSVYYYDSTNTRKTLFSSAWVWDMGKDGSGWDCGTAIMPDLDSYDLGGDKAVYLPDEGSYTANHSNVGCVVFPRTITFIVAGNTNGVYLVTRNQPGCIVLNGNTAGKKQYQELGKGVYVANYPGNGNDWYVDQIR